jgi:hypothetical protein
LKPRPAPADTQSSVSQRPPVFLQAISSAVVLSCTETTSREMSSAHHLDTARINRRSLKLLSHNVRVSNSRVKKSPMLSQRWLGDDER